MDDEDITRLSGFETPQDKIRHEDAQFPDRWVYVAEAARWSFRARYMEDPVYKEKYVHMEARHRTTHHAARQQVVPELWNDLVTDSKMFLNMWVWLMRDVEDIDRACTSDPHTCGRPPTAS